MASGSGYDRHEAPPTMMPKPAMGSRAALPEIQSRNPVGNHVRFRLGQVGQDERR